MRTQEVSTQDGQSPADIEFVDGIVVDVPVEPPVLNPHLSRALFGVIAKVDTTIRPATDLRDNKGPGSALAS
jgi:hypothetical protein